MATAGASGTRATDIGLLILRLCAGIVITVHGWQKLQGGVSGFAGFVAQVGLPAPTLLAWVVTLLELVGGLMLLIGLVSRVVGGLLAIQMLVTTFYVKAGQLGVGLIAQEGVGYELDLALLGAFAAVALAGPGAFALDAIVMRGSRGQRVRTAVS